MEREDQSPEEMTTSNMQMRQGQGEENDTLEYVPLALTGRHGKHTDIDLREVNFGERELVTLQQHSLLKWLKRKKPRLLISITAYNESWPQTLQTIAGCVRSAAELYDINEDEYKDRILIVLVQDGVPVRLDEG